MANGQWPITVDYPRAHAGTVWTRSGRRMPPERLALHSESTWRDRKPKKDRHLRVSVGPVNWAHASPVTCCGPRPQRRTVKRPDRDIGGGRRRTQGLRRPRIPVVTPVGRWGQSRAPSAPGRRSGVQYGRSVRDPIGPVALIPTNQVGRPSGLGMEAEASHEPSRSASAPGGRREKNGGASPGLG